MSTAGGTTSDGTGAGEHASADQVVARRRDDDEQMLARIRAVTEEAAEARRRRGPAEPLDADELATIDELTSAPDARSGFTLLRSRVEAGATTWGAVISETYEHGPAALQLKLAVMQRLYSRDALQPALDRLKEIESAVQADPQVFWDRVEEQRRERDAGGSGSVAPSDQPAPEDPAAPAPRPGTLGGGAPPADPRRRDDGWGAGSRG